MGSPDNVGGGGGSDIQVPLNVYQYLSSQSNSAEELQQKVAQWKAQQQALQNISGLAQQYPDRVQVDATHWVDPYTGNVFELKRGADKADGSQGDVSFSQFSDGDSKRYLASKGINLSTLGGSSGASGSTQRLTTDDPRYWDLEYAKLNSSDKQAADQIAEQYAQLGMTAENARRSALMQFINARDSLASNTAQTSAEIAKQQAEYYAAPRDTYKEAIYRNAVGGSTPFGDINNSAFGEYGKALAQKGVDLFAPVLGDLNASRQYRDALPLQDWLPADLRGSTGAGQPAAPASVPAGAGANPLAGLESFAPAVGHPDQLAAINQIANRGKYYGFDSPEQAMAMAKYFAAQQAASPTPQGPTTPQINLGGSAGAGIAPMQITLGKSAGSAVPTASTSPVDMPLAKAGGGYVPQPVQYAMGTRHHPIRVAGNITGSGFGSPGAFDQGGALNFDGMFDRSQPGYSPSSSEGGTNLSIHERAVIVGESGHVYGTLGEKRPDGTVRAEQLQIKPLKSEVAKDKRLEEGHKAIIESQKKTMAAFAGGGSVTSDPSLDEMDQQYSALLARLGGSGGGSNTPYGGARFLAGAPEDAIQSDPYLKGITEAGYSMRGVDPSELWAQVAKFRPSGIVNNAPRISWG